MAAYAHERLSALPQITLPVQELAALYTDAAAPLGAKEAAFPFLTMAYHRSVCLFMCCVHTDPVRKSRRTVKKLAEAKSLVRGRHVTTSSDYIPRTCTLCVALLSHV